MSDDAKTMVLVKVPMLQEKICSGAGKLGRGVPVRQTTGVETGKCLLDLQVVHVLAGEEEARLCDGFLPGAGDSFRRSFGDGSDGVRSLAWKPENPNYRIDLTHGDDPATFQRLYEGVVSVKRAELRLNAKHAVLTLFCRLGAVDPDLIPEFARNFSMPVQYTLTEVVLQGATQQGNNGPLFGHAPAPQQGQGSQDAGPPIGSLVTAVVQEDGEDVEVVGRVVSVAGGRVVLHRWLDGTGPVDVALSEVVTTTLIAGPQGGDPHDAIEKLLDQGAGDDLVVEPKHLLLALLASNDESPVGPWRITVEVRDLAVGYARDDVPDPE